MIVATGTSSIGLLREIEGRLVEVARLPGRDPSHVGPRGELAYVALDGGLRVVRVTAGAFEPIAMSGRAALERRLSAPRYPTASALVAQDGRGRWTSARIEGDLIVPVGPRESALGENGPELRLAAPSGGGRVDVLAFCAGHGVVHGLELFLVEPSGSARRIRHDFGRRERASVAALTSSPRGEIFGAVWSRRAAERGDPALTIARFEPDGRKIACIPLGSPIASRGGEVSLAADAQGRLVVACPAGVLVVATRGRGAHRDAPLGEGRTAGPDPARRWRRPRGRAPGRRAAWLIDERVRPG
jgi:hypothetical protein